MTGAMLGFIQRLKERSAAKQIPKHPAVLTVLGLIVATRSEIASDQIRLRRRDLGFGPCRVMHAFQQRRVQFAGQGSF